MAGLKDSNVNESGTTPRATHKAVISAEKPSLGELDWAIWEIYPKIREPTSIN